MEKLKVMAVVCHPADAIDHSGGTLCLHAERGDDVTVVVCTHGVDTHDWLALDDAFSPGRVKALDHAESLDRKEREVVEGMEILGVKDVRFLRFSDDLITATKELIEALANEMADIQPHLLILHNPTEEGGLADVGHADTAIAAMKAHYLANTLRFLKNPSGRKFPAQIYFNTMCGWTSRLSFEGNRFGSVLVDITSVVDRKIRAMDCLRTQYYAGDVGRKIVEDINGRMGLHLRVPYAESFQPYLPEVHSSLPANDYLLRLHEESMSYSYGLDRMRVMVNDVKFEP